MEAKLGDYIRTTSNNHYGRVKGKYNTFWETPESDEWFDNLASKPDESTKKEPWYSVLTHIAGSVLVPESDIRRVSDKPIGTFENPAESFYFRKVPMVNRILYGFEAKEFYQCALVEKEKDLDTTVCLNVKIGGYWRDDESNIWFGFDNWSNDLRVDEFDLEEEAAKFANGQTAINKQNVEL